MREMKIEKLRDKRKLLVFFLCAIFFLLRLFMGTVRYEENDDTGLNLLAAGIQNDQSQYLTNVNSNIVYGYFLKVLFYLLPKLNCYLWTILAADFLAITVICLILAEREEISPGMVLFQTVLINWLLGLNYYNALQYTKSASLLAIAGYASCITYIKNKKKMYLILLFILFFLSIGMRYNCFLLMSPFGAVTAAYLFGKDLKEHRKEILISMGCILFLYLSMTLSNRLAYSSEEWRHYREYDEARTRVTDYSNLEYERYAEELDRNQISETDIRMLHDWIHYDTEIFSVESMRLIADICGGGKKLEFSPAKIRGTFRAIMERVRTYRIGMVTVFMILMGLILADHRTKPLVLILAAIHTAEYWYLVCMNRLMWRVEVGIWLAVLLLILIVLNGERKEPEKKHTIYFLLIGAILLFLMEGRSLWKTFSGEKHFQIAPVQETSAEFYAELRSRPDHFYFGIPVGDILPGEKNVYDITKDYESYADNYALLGGWRAECPYVRRQFQRYGIDNPVASLLTNDNVFLASDAEHAELILEFLRQHYNGRTVMEQEDSIQGIQIWSYYEE